jgi:hypothetical protein
MKTCPGQFRHCPGQLAHDFALMRVSRLGGFRGCRVLDASVCRILYLSGVNESGSGFRTAKNPQKRETNGGSFMVLELDALSKRLKAFLQA